MAAHQRQPVPLRLVQSMWDMNAFAVLNAQRRRNNNSNALHHGSTALRIGNGSGGAVGGLQSYTLDARGAPTPYLVVFKPCGLPLYPPSNASSTRRTSSMGRRFESPSPSDLSDCLLHRLVDNMAAGATPMVVGFGPTAPPSHHAVASTGASDPALLQLLSRGLETVVTTSKDAAFLQDCMRFGLLTCAYYVLVHVPPCVHAASRHAWDASNARSQQLRKQFQNPYLVEHLHRRERSGSGGAGGASPAVTAPCGLASTRATFGIRGTVFDPSTGQLLREGTLGAVLCRHDLGGDHRRGRRVGEATQHLEQARRLASLFDPTEAVAPSSDLFEQNGDASCALCSQRHRDGNDPQLTLYQGHLVGVPGRTVRRPLDIAAPGHRFNGAGARDVEVAFRLVETSAQRPLALYHVSTTNATEEDIAMLFASQNLFVAGDVVYNKRLGAAFRGAAAAFQQAYVAQLDQLKASGRFVVTGVHRHRVASSTPETLLLPVLLQHQRVPSPAHSPPQSAPLHEGSARVGPDALRKLARGVMVRSVSGMPSSVLEDWLVPLRGGFGFGIARTQWHLPRATSANLAMLQKRIMDEQLRLRSSSAMDAPERQAATSVTQQRLDCEVYDIVGAPPSFVQFLRQPERADADGDGPPMVREEEHSDLYCPMCCVWGHTMQQCATAHEAPLELLSEGTTHSNDGAGEMSAAVAPRPDAADANEQRRTEEDATPSTLRELKRYLDQGTFARQQGHDEQQHATGAGMEEDDEGVVKVPNAAKTDHPQFNPHASRQRQKTPALHRRRLRCAYCHANTHHITECPRLPGGAPAAANGRVPAATGDDDRRLALTFCIRCGQRGHLYSACPTLPRGLHAAMHCPICHMAQSKGAHDPQSCPRRVRVPDDCLPSGAPRA